MNYEQEFKKAAHEHRTKTLTPEFFKWEKKGQSIIGKYLSRDIITSQTNEQQYYQYVFETTKGAVKCHMGGKFDGEVGELLVKGMILRIEFQGKEEIGKGRSVNLFDVQVAVQPESEAGLENEDDVPF